MGGSNLGKKRASVERYIKDYFEKQKYVVYMPATDSAHGFDMILYKENQYPFAVEVKTKASSEKFNEKSIEKYLFDRYAYYMRFPQNAVITYIRRRTLTKFLR